MHSRQLPVYLAIEGRAGRMQRRERGQLAGALIGSLAQVWGSKGSGKSERGPARGGDVTSDRLDRCGGGWWIGGRHADRGGNVCMGREQGGEEESRSEQPWLDLATTAYPCWGLASKHDHTSRPPLNQDRREGRDLACTAAQPDPSNPSSRYTPRPGHHHPHQLGGWGHNNRLAFRSVSWHEPQTPPAGRPPHRVARD